MSTTHKNRALNLNQPGTETIVICMINKLTIDTLHFIMQSLGLGELKCKLSFLNQRDSTNRKSYISNFD